LFRKTTSLEVLRTFSSITRSFNRQRTEHDIASTSDNAFQRTTTNSVKFVMSKETV